MHYRFAEQLQEKLEKRFEKLKSSGFETYHQILQQFWHFLEKTPIYSLILGELRTSHPQMDASAKQIFVDRKVIKEADEERNQAMCYFLLKRCAESQTAEEHSIAIRFRHGYPNESVVRFTSLFVEPIVSYIAEHLETQKLAIFLICQYKLKSEWFQRETLFDVWKKFPKNAEDILKNRLNEYLFDQGLFVLSEPLSPSGRADHLAQYPTTQQTGSITLYERLVGESKIFNPEKSRGKSYILQAFRQLLAYMYDHSESVGHLIIFNTSETQLTFELPPISAAAPLGFQLVTNNLVIYVYPINICLHEASASKRKPSRCIEITKSELLAPAIKARGKNKP